MSDFPQPKQQETPCGECHLPVGEVCDICGAHRHTRKPDNPDLITDFMQRLKAVSMGGKNAYMTVGSREYAAELYLNLVKLGVPAA